MPATAPPGAAAAHDAAQPPPPPPPPHGQHHQRAAPGITSSSGTGGGVPLASPVRVRGLAKLEDLEVALNAALHVNRHLNCEIEGVVQQLQRAEAERLAWQEHARRLAGQLARCKRAAAAAAAGAADAAAGADDGGDEGALAERLAALPPADQQQSAADREAAEAAAAAVPPAFPCGDALAGEVDRLLAKGRAAGWLAAPGDVALGEPLGRGAFGTTFKAGWRGAQVAVKCVSVRSETELLNFLREVECLAALRHPNVVPFLGAVIDGRGAACWLISEFMAGGTLAAWLHDGKGPLGPAQPMLARAGRALDVCRALAALEAAAPPLLHRDVKPSNVFLDASGAARLGDFGLARPLPASRATLTGETGTYLYMAPEMIRHELYDTKADVWSFGVLLAELLTGVVPYAYTYMTPVQIAMGVADEKLRPLLPQGLPPGLAALAAACCDFDPEMRPAFGALVPELEAAVDELRREAEAAAAGGLWNRLMGSSTVPSSWTSVLASAGSGGGGDAVAAGAAKN